MVRAKRAIIVGDCTLCTISSYGTTTAECWGQDVNCNVWILVKCFTHINHGYTLLKLDMAQCWFPVFACLLFACWLLFCVCWWSHEGAKSLMNTSSTVSANSENFFFFSSSATDWPQLSHKYYLKTACADFMYCIEVPVKEGGTRCPTDSLCLQSAVFFSCQV